MLRYTTHTHTRSGIKTALRLQKAISSEMTAAVFFLRTFMPADAEPEQKHKTV